MSYRPHGRAHVDPTNPQAFAVCDFCGFLFNHNKLRFNFDYRGSSLQNTRYLVCKRCNDKPQPQLKPRIIPPDPKPIENPRFEPYAIDEA